MAQRLNAQAAPTLSISKICDAQREFDSSVRALNDFYVRKKRAKNGSTGILLTPTRALHEKGLVSSPYLQIAANCARMCNEGVCRLQITLQWFQLNGLNVRAPAPLPCTPTLQTCLEGAECAILHSLLMLSMLCMFYYKCRFTHSVPGRVAHTAIARCCLPSVTLPATAAADIANEIRGAICANPLSPLASILTAWQRRRATVASKCCTRTLLCP